MINTLKTWTNHCFTTMADGSRSGGADSSRSCGVVCGRSVPGQDDTLLDELQQAGLLPRTRPAPPEAVSYTHLTLPTILLV